MAAMKRLGDGLRGRLAVPIWAILGASPLLAIAALAGPSASAATRAIELAAPAHAAPSAQPAAAPADALIMEAEHLDLDVQTHTATLVGKVRLSRGDLEVRAGRVEARYNDDPGAPRVTTAKATGGVVAEIRGIRAEAPELSLDLTAQTVHLTGGVRIARGAGWLTAASASIHTGTLKVSMTSVKGSLPIADVSR